MPAWIPESFTKEKIIEDRYFPKKKPDIPWWQQVDPTGRIALTKGVLPQFTDVEPQPTPEWARTGLKGLEWAVSPFAVAGQATIEPFTEQRGQTKGRQETLYNLKQANLKRLQNGLITHEEFMQRGKEINDLASSWEREKFPGGTAYEKYRQRPLWQQLLAESPAFLATAAIP